MTLAIQARSIPLREDENGTIWVSDTRVPLDTVIFAYRNGDSAEEIVENFNTLKLADVYVVIGYYLDHQIEVNAYLQKRQAEAASLQKEIETQFSPHGLRQRLLARQAQHD